MKPAHTLKIPSLGKGWCDKDVVVIHACFQLLQDCVEQEDLFGTWGRERNPAAAKAKRELRQLSRWWQKRKMKSLDDFLSCAGVRQYNRDTAQLVRLVKLRRYLWT